MIVRSDYEQQKILSEIMESEKQRYKFVKNKALIPSMLLSSRDRFVSHRLQTVYTNELYFDMQIIRFSSVCFYCYQFKALQKF